jgi:hypothetical protein
MSMVTGGMTPTPASGSGPRSVWPVALVALAVLFVMSEVTYLAVATLAKANIDGGGTALDGVLGALSNSLFVYGEDDAARPVLMLKSFFGLPGFNTLYFLVFWPLDMIRPMPFITSGLAAPLVGFLAIFGHLSMSAGHGGVVRLVSAVVFAVGWVVLYTAAEASMYGDGFWTEFPLHVLEIPTTFASLLAASLIARRYE